MTNPYSMGAYPQNFQYPQYPPEMIYGNEMYPQATVSRGPSVLAMTALGGVGGGTIGYLKHRHPVSKDGSISEKFLKDVFEKNLKHNAPSESRNYFKQLNDVLKKIDKVKSTEEFKKLIKSNKLLIDSHCKGISCVSLLDSINSSNLSASKLSLQEALKGIQNFEMRKTKNAIRHAWDFELKKFVKPDNFKDEKLFNIIKNTSSKNKWYKALKYGGITGGVMGCLAIVYKLLTAQKNS